MRQIKNKIVKIEKKLEKLLKRKDSFLKINLKSNEVFS